MFFAGVSYYHIITIFKELVMLNMYRSTVLPHVKVLNLTTPVNAQFEITTDCSYRCIMCYNVWRGLSTFRVGKPLSKEEHFKILKILDRYIVLMIFSGGEPTGVLWLPDLVSQCRKDNVDCSIISNGVNITQQLSKRLKGAGLQEVQISLHHYDQKINDWITNTENSVSMTLTGAHNIMSALGSEFVGVCMVANTRTYKDVYNMGRFLKNEGFKNLAVGVLSYSGMAVKNGLLLNATQLNDMFDQLKAVNKDFGLTVGFTGGFPECILPKGWKDTSVEMYNTCDAAISQIVVSADGECRPCVEYPYSGGNILSQDLKDIWQSPVFLSIRNFEDVPKFCYQCKMVSSCRGGCRAAALNYSGVFQGPDPLFDKKGRKQ